MAKIVNRVKPCDFFNIFFELDKQYNQIKVVEPINNTKFSIKSLLTIILENIVKNF